MNREKARQVFQDYVEKYDTSDIKVQLKIAHTYRVADIAEWIARSQEIDMDDYSVDFCWLLGLLHDIGRFEQLKRYGTFVDRDSVDHAELGADILFKDGLIEEFIDPKEWEEPDYPNFAGWSEMAPMAETAIRLHNKLSLPTRLDPATSGFVTILRDADKVDIFRVLTEFPYNERNERVIAFSKSQEACGAKPEVMQCVYEHRCVPRVIERNEFEAVISSCCMGFELSYPISRRIVKEQGYLNKLMNLSVENGTMAEQLEVLRNEMAKVLDNQDGIEAEDDVYLSTYDALKDSPDAVKELDAIMQQYIDRLKPLVESFEALTKIDRANDTELLRLNEERETIEREKSERIAELLRGEVERKKLMVQELRAESKGLLQRMHRRETGRKIYPNDPCPCGSGKKYKKCCGVVGQKI